MKILLPMITITLAITACSTTPSQRAYLPAQGEACIEQHPQVNGHESKVRWCIASRMFQPRNYHVTLDKEIIFNGTDYERVKFSKDTLAGKITGHCDEYVRLVKMTTDQPVPTASLPATMVQACGIGTATDGSAKEFLKSEDCDKPFYESLGSSVAPILPIETQRVCKVELEGRPIFEGKFDAARRF